MALNEAYDAIPDLVDAVFEGYQGASEKLLNIPNNLTPPVIDTVEQALEFCRMKSENISLLQKEIPYSEIVNNMDLIKDCLNKLKYKLIFLH